MFVSDHAVPQPRGETRRAVAAVGRARACRRLRSPAPSASPGRRCASTCVKLGHPARSRGRRRRYDWAAIRAYYELATRRRDCQQEFGFGRNAWADAVARGAIDHDLEPSRSRISWRRDDGAHRNNLKLRLIAGGLKDQQCELCGCREWRGEPIALQLHHVNGDGADNRLANLQLLCPELPQPDRHVGSPEQSARDRARRQAEVV